MTYQLQVIQANLHPADIWPNFIKHVREQHAGYTINAIPWSMIDGELHRYGARDHQGTGMIEFDREEDRTWFVLRFS